MAVYGDRYGGIYPEMLSTADRIERARAARNAWVGKYGKALTVYNKTQNTRYNRSKGLQIARRSNVAGSAVRNVRTAGLLGLELKFYDQAGSGGIGAPTDASGGEIDPSSDNCIGAPAQGNSAQQRNGKQYVVKSISVKGSIYIAAQTAQTAADTAGQLFVALVQDTQSNAEQLNSEDVFTNPAAVANSAADPLRNMSHIKRFKVLDVFSGTMDQAQMVWDGSHIIQGGFYIPFSLSFKGNVKVNGIDGVTESGITGVDDNSFHVIAYTSNQGLNPIMVYNARTRFMG